MLFNQIRKCLITTSLLIVFSISIDWKQQFVIANSSQLNNDCNFVDNLDYISDTIIFLQKPNDELYSYDLGTHEIKNLEISAGSGLVYFLSNNQNFLTLSRIPQLFIPPIILEETGGLPPNFLNTYTLEGDLVDSILWDNSWSKLLAITSDNKSIFLKTGFSTSVLEVSLDTKEIVNLGDFDFTSDVLSDYVASVNSQATYIAYTETRPTLGGGELIIASLDSNRELWRGEFYFANDLLFNINWSPDGTQLAFPRKMDDVWQIFVWNTEIFEPKQITVDNHELGISPRRILYLTWSPDSKKIAYWRTNDFLIEPLRPESNLYILDIENQNITKYCVPENSLALPMHWSSDMRYIALSTSQSDIYILATVH
jgi:hypothetical protein